MSAENVFMKALKYDEKFVGLGGVQNVCLQHQHKVSMSVSMSVSLVPLINVSLVD